MSNELERRALLGAAGLGAVAAMAAAANARGPLNPPGGAVAGTGRTLDEIYNKIPVAGAADGRTPIPGGNAGFTITQPGSYILTGNLSALGTALTINNPGGPVTLDLNGFRISTTSTSFAAVSINTCPQVVIRNGHISGGFSGLSVSNCPGAVIEDLRVSATRVRGIDLSGNNSVGAAVRRCTLTDIGLLTPVNDTFDIYGIATSPLYGVRIEDCQVSRLVHNGNAPGTLNGIAINTGGYVSGCVVGNSSTVPLSTGITLSGSSVYRNNQVHNFATLYTGGVDGGGNF